VTRAQWLSHLVPTGFTTSFSTSLGPTMFWQFGRMSGDRRYYLYLRGRDRCWLVLTCRADQQPSTWSKLSCATLLKSRLSAAEVSAAVAFMIHQQVEKEYPDA
jgi:hypothetical protein